MIFSLESRLTRELRKQIERLEKDLERTREDLYNEQRRADKAIDQLLQTKGARPVQPTPRTGTPNLESIKEMLQDTGMNGIDPFSELSEEEFVKENKEVVDRT